MVFKRLLMAFGVGGPSLDTVLRSPHTRPGEFLEGVVELSGGDHEVFIEEIAVCLASAVEVEAGDVEGTAGVEFARFPVTGAFRLGAGERHSIPFRYPVPLQAPITAARGGPLPGTGVGLRTDVVIDHAPDKGDLDPVLIHPLPVQDRILEAFARLGFALKHTDLEHGHLAGTAQQFPFFQEIEFHPSPRYAHEINEVEVSFVADHEGVDVIIEFDRRGGLFTEGQDLYGRFRAAHADVDRVDWAAQVDGWIAQALERHRGLFGGYGHHGYHGGHGHHGGGGLGETVLGIAGGLAAGFVAGEIIDEIGDMLEGDDD
ncbi:sporulation protein [Thermobifida cellulosilytica]|uniref:Sporulation protein n=1 Tax=Thermobifida cellulosilytica TB100 TaxID=665004 RepID=A0A147KKE7_THECS|nr:sporulation protein [Thermobifida cellulosilytica]KUP97764.1 sporulation protein [Thermobifida cellulosilytica TB100]